MRCLQCTQQPRRTHDTSTAKLLVEEKLERDITPGMGGASMCTGFCVDAPAASVADTQTHTHTHLRPERQLQEEGVQTRQQQAEK